MTRSRTHRVLLATIALLAPLVASAPAQADGPYEPNNTTEQATGPVHGGTDISARQENRRDEDWYFFYAAGERQIDISVQASECGRPVELALYNVDGRKLNSVSARGYRPEVVHLKFTSPAGITKYYLRASDLGAAQDYNCAYRFRIDPADAITTTPPTGSSATPPSGQSTPPPPPVVPPPPPPPAAKPFNQYATALTVRRSGNRIVGRLTSRSDLCIGAERVILRRVGAPTRIYQATDTTWSGRFSLPLPKRRGRYYVVHKRVTWNLDSQVLRCGYSSSRTIRR